MRGASMRYGGQRPAQSPFVRFYRRMRATTRAAVDRFTSGVPVMRRVVLGGLVWRLAPQAPGG